MFNKTTFFTLILALAVLLSGCATAAAAQTDDPDTIAEEHETEEMRKLSVNGSGIISLTPDIARISIGVQTEDENASEAVASNNSQAKGIMDALLGFGIAAADIRTSNFSIYPRQDIGPEGERTGTYYIVNNTVQVTVRDLTEIGEILDAVVKAGANSIGGIQFDVSDREAANQRALEAAVLNAQSRADVMANTAGVTLGAVQTIDSYLGGGPVPMFRGTMVESMAADVSISPGEMEITAEVSVVFEIH